VEHSQVHASGDPRMVRALSGPEKEPNDERATLGDCKGHQKTNNADHYDAILTSIKNERNGSQRREAAREGKNQIERNTAGRGGKDKRARQLGTFANS